MTQPIRLACFGDSLMWGQGLLPADKFARLVWDALARGPEAGAPRSPQAAEFVMCAHAGAQIGATPRPAASAGRDPAWLTRVIFGPRSVPPWMGRELAGEIGNAAPSVHEQIAAFDGDPLGVDLVLVNGGGNDVGVFWYMNPATSIAALKRRIETYCYTDMVALLLKVAATFPNACIVVPGYMQSLSPATARGLAAAPGGLLARLLVRLCRVLLDRVFERNLVFREETARQLRRAVESASAALSAPERAAGAADQARGCRMLFAEVETFAAGNAANGSDPWVWGVDTSVCTPQDPLCEFRRGACARLGHWSAWYWASIGHPNALGARQIADGILRTLHAWSAHPVAPAADGLRTAAARAGLTGERG